MSECTNNSDSSGAIVLEDLFYTARFGSHATKCQYQMDHFAAHEEQLASQRMRQKLEEVNVAAQTNFVPVQSHLHYIVQKTYFKCAYECFDRSKSQEEISSCVEKCSVLSNLQHTLEMAQFQERLNRSLRVCQDKYKAARLQNKNDAMKDLVSCAERSIQKASRGLLWN
ncbi:hypothetical protein D0Y65_016097 [Glycine soja]|nr:hypothetical protein D0Y65_016094 [Glycine soja]RZC09605.1 hypothetical protein D0Y65_016097 [Glycine soja]